LFRAAAEAFASAASLDPGLLDASLHRGRAWILAGEPAKAVQPLTAAAQSPDRHVRYLAVMFLGAIAEADGQLEEAEVRYRAAAATAPFGQSAPLALAHLFGRTGRDAEARALLSGHFARTRGRVAEPLWTYLGAPADHLGESLQELRAEVWR
jgi:Tfp pilus assembly protein PilF